MSTAAQDNSTVHRFDSLDYVGTDPLSRDMTQSRRLHEPEHMISTIDPISGRDIQDLEGRPYIEDGNLLIYFESEETRQAYLEMSMEHSVPLPDNPIDDWVAEG